MKKIFKAISVLAATAALGTGVALASGCAGGNGTYYGEYHYISANTIYPYGMVVEVTVKNNIITDIKDITNSDNAAAKELQTYKDVIDGVEAKEATYHSFTTVSPGWETYIGTDKDSIIAYTYWAYPGVDFSNMTDDEKVEYVTNNPVYYYGWTDSSAKNWTDHVSWLLQQYVGWSVADVLAIDVYTNYGYEIVTKDGELKPSLDTSSKGEPYATSSGYNAEMDASGLLISGSTQGSGRLLLAVQNALGK